jgi:phosphoglycolate phosphatase
MSPYPCKLFLFDLDGTLIDSKTDIIRSVNLALGRMKFPTVADTSIARFVGDGVQKLIQRTLRASLGAEPESRLVTTTIQAYLEEYAEHLLDSTSLFPGIREALNALWWADCAVITNKPENFSRQILEFLGVASRFCVILGGDSTEKRKPDPGPLGQVMSLCDARPSETVMVGDSHVDIRAGKAAGVITCGILGGFGTREELEAEGCDLILDGASELARHFCPPGSSGQRPLITGH